MCCIIFIFAILFLYDFNIYLYIYIYYIILSNVACAPKTATVPDGIIVCAGVCLGIEISTLPTIQHQPSPNGQGGMVANFSSGKAGG